MRCHRCGGHRFNPDENIRRLERDANLGDVNAEAKLIISKVRTGIIPSKYVALAAYLKDPAALATGIEPWNDWRALEQPDAITIPIEWLRIGNVLRFGDITQEILIASAADFAEHVLYIFENMYPNDNRPRSAIQAARTNIDASVAANNAADAAVAASAAGWGGTPAEGNGQWRAVSYAAHSAANAARTVAHDIYICVQKEFAPYYAADASNDAVYAIYYSNNITTEGLIPSAHVEIAWQAKRLCDYLLDRRQII